MLEHARPADVSAEDGAATRAPVRALVEAQQQRLEEQDERLRTLEAQQGDAYSSC